MIDDDIKYIIQAIHLRVIKRLSGELDRGKLYLFFLKKPKYVVILMSTYSSLNFKRDKKNSIRYDNNGCLILFMSMML